MLPEEGVRFCLYTMGRWQTIGPMLDITLPNKIEYCKRHGYALHFEEWDGGMFPGFARLPVLIYLLKCGYYDWVFWLGSDALITNLNTKLESLVSNDCGIIVATDFTQIQLDSFLIRRGHGALELMEKVWTYHDNPIGPWWEQSTLDELVKQPPFNNVVKIVPQRTLNAYRHKWYANWIPENWRIGAHQDCMGTDGEWRPNDFIFHIPGRPLETKMNALSEIVPLIRR